MAMQQSSKGVSGTASNPALSDEQAEQFAASFTPAWDADDAHDATTSGTPDAAASMGTESTQIMDRAELAKAQEEAAAPPIVGTPAIIFNTTSTMIGVPPPGALAARPASATVPVAVAPPAPPAVAEAIESANVLEVVAAPAPVRPNPAMRTQIMHNRPPGPGRAPAAPSQGAATLAARPNDRTAAPVPIADPFRDRGPSSDDLFPRRSNKTVLFVAAGLVVAAGVGLFLKFALGEDTPKPAAAAVVTGPAITTAEIPPPPPKDEAPPAPTAAFTAAARTAEPAPPPLATPPPLAAAVAPVAAAPLRNEPHPARTAALPPPPAAAAPPSPAAASPKSAPKASNGGIVRDNPF